MRQRVLAFASVMFWGALGLQSVTASAAEDRPSQPIIVPAPSCADPRAMFANARKAALEAEKAGDFALAASAWRRAVEAARCENAPDPFLEALALASEGQTLIWRNAHGAAAERLNASLDLYLRNAPEQASFEQTPAESNIAAAFGLRELVSAIIGEPRGDSAAPDAQIGGRASRLLEGRLSESRYIRRNWRDQVSVLTRDNVEGVSNCRVNLTSVPDIQTKLLEHEVAVVVVRLAVDSNGTVVSADLAATIPEGLTVAESVRDTASYQLDFASPGDCRIQSGAMLIAFRFGGLSANRNSLRAR